jgi:hypothetical protein
MPAAGHPFQICGRGGQRGRRRRCRGSFDAVRKLTNDFAIRIVAYGTFQLCDGFAGRDDEQLDQVGSEDAVIVGPGEWLPAAVPGITPAVEQSG